MQGPRANNHFGVPQAVIFLIPRQMPGFPCKRTAPSPAAASHRSAAEDIIFCLVRFLTLLLRSSDHLPFPAAHQCRG